MGINEGGGVCAVCGYDSAKQNAADKLPTRYILSKRYVIGRVISCSCESVIYIALDTSTGKTVNIKEYFPEGISHRGTAYGVMPAEGREYVFNDGLLSFMELNRKLIGEGLPALPETYAVFEENGTAYSVTDAVTGISLKDFLAKNGGSLKWEQARPLFLPLIDTVNELNKAGIIHGGISPESVFVGRDGRVRIRDIFISRARRADREMTAQIYSGYAAVEQYKSELGELGSYTDVYGISATLYRVLIGAVPEDAVTRLESGASLTIPARFADELPRQVLVAMANGLKVLPASRTETVEKFRDELVYGETRENTKREENRRRDGNKETARTAEREKPEKDASEKGNLKVWLITAGSTIAVFAAVAAIILFTPLKAKLFGSDVSSEPSSSESSIPSQASIGDYDSSLVDSKVTYAVPDVRGMTFAQVTANTEFSRFKFTVSGKNYSDSYQKGQIISQSVNPDKQVESGTQISVVISLGAEKFTMPSLLGLSELEAKVELMRRGILYDNIEVVEKYDTDKNPGVVIEQSPAYGETITEESKVRIYVNSYDGTRGGQ